jgi:histidyl-tRNA synthetase
MIHKIRGTQDFLDTTLFNFIIEQTRNHLKFYGFQEIATPILEPVALFKRSLGLETDIVSKEMFIVKNEASSEEICLRPEATASTARAFLENSTIRLPWNVFSYGPMFRYERPQKGRFRQFHQINMEMIGAASIAYDALLLSMLDRLFSEVFKLDCYALTIHFLGCQQDRENFKATVHSFLDAHIQQLCDQCKVRKEKNILRVFDCKQESCKALYVSAPRMTDQLCTVCAEEWKELQYLLELLSISYTIVHTLVRGLDYYNKTVFEFVSMNLGAQNAFCGGGRYELMKQLGAQHEQSSLGVAIGIERLMLLLEPISAKLPLPQKERLHVILPFSKEQHPLALLIADTLLRAHLCTEILYDENTIGKMLKKADKLGARYALIVGPDEQKINAVTVKDLQTGISETIAQTMLISRLKSG